MKTCIRCEEDKETDLFTPDKRNKDGTTTYCLECNETLSRAAFYWRRNQDAYNAGDRRRRRDLRVEILLHYGNCCRCCGEDSYEFLSIDHIDGGGRKHREEVGTGYSFYRWLKRNEYPDGYRVLCHNCNQSLGFYGYCPHGNLD